MCIKGSLFGGVPEGRGGVSNSQDFLFWRVPKGRWDLLIGK